MLGSAPFRAPFRSRVGLVHTSASAANLQVDQDASGGPVAVMHTGDATRVHNILGDNFKQTPEGDPVSIVKQKQVLNQLRMALPVDVRDRLFAKGRKIPPEMQAVIEEKMGPLQDNTTVKGLIDPRTDRPAGNQRSFYANWVQVQMVYHARTSFPTCATRCVVCAQISDRPPI